MAQPLRPPPQPHVLPEHPRRDELVHPARVRREFTKREAQRHLQAKESQWAPIAYAVFLVAILVIFCIAYVTYAFSKYRNEILPGVQVDRVSVAGLSAKQAARLIDNQEALIGHSPVVLVFGPRTWTPTQQDIGFYPQPNVTAQHAMDVGRTESFVVQLIDRLPLHPTHRVPLAYNLGTLHLESYIRSRIAVDETRGGISRATLNARIVPVQPLRDDFRLQPARDGLEVDVPGTANTMRSILGSLRKQTRVVSVIHTHAAVTNADALAILRRVKRFLAATPVIGVEKRVFATARASFAHMISFQDVRQGDGHWLIKMVVDSQKVHTFVQGLATQIDRPAQDAKIDFSGGRVVVLQPQSNGRTLDQDATYASILKAVTALTPRARIRLKVSVTQPPIDVGNPASLGINTLLGEGTSSFQGASSTRLDDVTAIAKALDNTLIRPHDQISLNTLLGTNWLDRMYDDRERSVGGQLVPGNHGAMQQVATTFLRAMYNTGLTVLERHPHPYRLSWYEPPIGLDAEVFPARNWDLRFQNSTGKYLLIETRVEPVRQQLYIYVYGPKLDWKVRVDRLGKIVKTFPHGPTVRREDASLPAGEVLQTAFAHDGAQTVVQRTITYSNGKVNVDEIDTMYRPWQAIVVVGAAPRATPVPPPGAHSTPVPTPTGGPHPTPSPTFSH